MFSLPQHPSSSLVVLNLALLFAIFLFQRRALWSPYSIPQSRRLVSIILIFIFVLFSFWGEDWFHYYEAYPDLCQGYRGHMEEVYVWIAQHLSVGYLSFRFAVWGTGLILLLLTIERLPLKKDLIILFFGSLWIIWFSYARVSIGLALCFWGLAVLYNPYRFRLLSRALAVAAISVSFYFHKSVFVLIIAIVLTIMSLRLKKQLFFILLFVSVPLIIYFIRNNIATFFLLDADANEGGFGQSIYFGQQYLESGQSSGRVRGIGELSATVIGSIPYYMLLVQSVLLTVKRVYNNEPRVLQSFIRLFILIILIASFFLLNIGISSMVLYVRFLRFAAFPCAVLLAYYWEKKFYPGLTKWTLYMAALSTLYSVSYSLYLNI